MSLPKSIWWAAVVTLMLFAVAVSTSCSRALFNARSFSKSEKAILRRFRANEGKMRVNEGEEIMGMLSERGITNFTQFDIIFLLGPPTLRSQGIMSYQLNDEATLRERGKYDLLIVITNKAQQIGIYFKPSPIDGFPMRILL